ncbi:cytochrome P450 [Mycena latifolia]|nr:cytochrome P450 [Mycena latifolia]
MLSSPQFEGLNFTSFVGAAAALAFLIFQCFSSNRSRLDNIPTFGVPFRFGFYIGSWNYIKRAHTITQDGCAKYPGVAFKVPLINRWLVVITGREMIDDIRRASVEQLSLDEAANSLFHLEHVLGYEQYHDPFQIPVIRTTLTRNIGACFPDAENEVIAAFKDLIPAQRDAWISVSVTETFLQIISRTFNRMYIGLPCRDPDYIALTAKFPSNATHDAALLTFVPTSVRPLVARLFGSLEGATRSAMKHLGPIIQYRLDMDDKYGPDWDRPNDLISWLLDASRGHPERRTMRTLTRYLINVNFGSIHTTTQAFIQVLYNLAAYPQHCATLREEIETIVNLEGWTRSAMTKMTKVDSFLMESFRCSPPTAVSALRQVMSDFTFSNGTVIPAGTIVGLGVHAKDEFDPFGASRMKDQLVIPSPDFLVFGIGRQACPGRFVATTVLKLLTAKVVMEYDLKFKDRMRPENEWTSLIMNANPKSQIMFCKRA